MKRKVVKHGPSTYIVSLPSSWVKQQNIKKGDELEVTEYKDHLLVGNNFAPFSMKAKINLSDLDRTTILLIIRSFYRLGYDALHINFDKPTTIYPRTNEKVSLISTIHTEVNRLIGYEILEETKDSCLIRDMQSTSATDFKAALRRIFLLINDLGRTFIDCLKEDDMQQMGDISNKHDTITKFISYCFRLLNKQREETQQSKFYYSMVLHNLEQITDVFMESAKIILKDNKKPKYLAEAIKLIEEICNSIDMYYNLFYKYDKAKAIEIQKKRYEIEQNLMSLSQTLKFSQTFVLTSLFQITEYLHHLNSDTSVMHLHKDVSLSNLKNND